MHRVVEMSKFEDQLCTGSSFWHLITMLKHKSKGAASWSDAFKAVDKQQQHDFQRIHNSCISNFVLY